MDTFFITETNNLCSEVTSRLPYYGTLPEFSKVVAGKYADFIQKHPEDFGMGVYPATNPTEFQLFAEEVVFNLMRIITKRKDKDTTGLQDYDPIKVVVGENILIKDVPIEGPMTIDNMKFIAIRYLDLFPTAYHHKGWEKNSLTKKMISICRGEVNHESAASEILKRDPGLSPDDIIQQVLVQGVQDDKAIRKGIQDKMRTRWWSEDESPMIKAAAIFDLMNAADCLHFVTKPYAEHYKSTTPSTLRTAWRKAFD